LLCVLTACAGTEQSTRSLVRDSAGVLIVERSDVFWPAGKEWRISAIPIVSIGEVEGPPAFRFHRIQDVVRFEDGSIAVADGSQEIRFFDAAGAHIRSVGRNGEGPGEYRAISLFKRYGQDSLLVWDEALRRGTLLGRDGGLGRTFAGPGFQETFYFFLDTFADGSLLGVVAQGVTHTDTARTEVRRTMATYFRFRTTGEVDTIGRFLDGESFIRMSDRLDVIPMPFGFSASTAVYGDRVYYGWSETYDIRSYDSAGGLLRVLRLARAPQELTAAMRDSFVERQISRLRDEDARRRRLALYQAVPYHDRLPAFSALKVDAEANLWVANYARPGQDRSRWTIFNEDGEVLGSIATPPRFTLQQIGSDHLVGVARDSLDVERVVILPLMKSQ
jgi:hypothetical protein